MLPLFNNSHPFSLCTEKNPFYNISHQSFHHWTWCSLPAHVPTLFFLQLNFASVPENFFQHLTVPKFTSSFLFVCLFFASIIKHMIFLLYLEKLPSSLMEKFCYFLKILLRSHLLMWPLTPEPPNILSHSHMYKATLSHLYMVKWLLYIFPFLNL